MRQKGLSKILLLGILAVFIVLMGVVAILLYPRLKNINVDSIANCRNLNQTYVKLPSGGKCILNCNPGQTYNGPDNPPTESSDTCYCKNGWQKIKSSVTFICL